MEDSSLSAHEQGILAERVRAGDNSSEEELVRLFYARAFALLVARTRDREASRDIAQEVMIAVIHALRAGRLREPEKLGAFIQGIARNLANNFVRTRVLQRAREEDLPPDLAHTLRIADAEVSDRERLVHDALTRLESTDRNILQMTLVDGFKSGEIAERLRLSSDFVRQRKSRAIRKLAEYIRKLSRTAEARHTFSRRGKR